MNFNLQGNKDAVFDVWKFSTRKDPPPPKTRWVTQEPFCFVGGWEALSFRQRSGYAWTDEEDYYKNHEFSNAELDRFVELGCNHLIIPFAKGLGLKASIEEVEQEKDIIRRAHERGLKVGVYFRMDNVVPDVLAGEIPQVKEWLSQGMHGRTSCYCAPQLTYRKNMCHLHPEVTEWLDGLVRYAITEMKADLLHLDGFSVTSFLWNTCRCERCVETYRKWLKAAYPDPHVKQQVFGYIDFDRCEPPLFEPYQLPQSIITAPEIKAWHGYLWDKHLAYARHLRWLTRSLSENVGMSFNPVFPGTSDYYITYSNWPERLFPWMDAVWIEDRMHFNFLNGHVISRAGLTKLVREYDLALCSYHWSCWDDQTEASIDFSLASNRGNASCLGFTIRHLPHYSCCETLKSHHAQWAKNSWELFKETQPDGKIAILRHALSLAWNGKWPWWGLFPMQQLLVHMKTGWRIFDRVDRALLDQVQTLILPNVESLSDEELATLKEWVEDGGNLMFTAHTGTHNEDRIRRPRHPIWDWTPKWRRLNDNAGSVDWYFWTREDYVEMDMDLDRQWQDPNKKSVGYFHTREGKIQIEKLGKGKLCFVPRINSPVSNDLMTGGIKLEELAPPRNHKEIKAALKQLHGPLDFYVSGPDSLFIESFWQPEKHRRLIHIVQSDFKAKPCKATIHFRDKVKARQISVHSPDKHPPRWKFADQKLELSAFERYVVVSCELAETNLGKKKL